MQTNLAGFIRDTPAGREADAILRKCVHCGFCNATCPTYQLTGDELDGPRGRIYLMKLALEGGAVSATTQLHLDRCLTCRACETTCPSGVQYGRLLDIGRRVVEERVPRRTLDRVRRAILGAVLPRRRLFAAALKVGQAVRPALPGALRRKAPARSAPPGDWPAPRHARRMLVLAGCVQPALAPGINAAAARVLDRVGISLVEAPGAGCCGAVRFHLNAQEAGLDDMRALIDAWWPHVEAGVEAIVMTASGCGATVREYGHLLAHDPRYAAKARRVSELTRDLCEVIGPEVERLAPALRDAERAGAAPRVAVHTPCTLQHAQKLAGAVDRILARAGFELAPVPEAHLCCGSAGTYSILQGTLAAQLKANKLTALQSGMPGLVVTANIGCLAHLAGEAQVPVRHWIAALEERLAGG
ncbi:MAG: glycolate oxidase subunit GlcF [Burkholderiales bacterium]|nr:glycolate oxidase subunit GlcF [Burkholderiales bacterium]